jgi:ATP-dependent Zn protease
MILSKKQMTIPGLITGFKYTDQYDLKLFSATNELIFDYPNQSLHENTTQSKKVVIRNENNFNEKKYTSDRNNALNLEKNEISENSLGASVVLDQENDIGSDKNQNKSYFFFWTFVVLLIVASVVVYYVRQRKNVPNDGDDFDIIDE